METVLITTTTDQQDILAVLCGLVIISPGKNGRFISHDQMLDAKAGYDYGTWWCGIVYPSSNPYHRNDCWAINLAWIHESI